MVGLVVGIQLDDPVGWRGIDDCTPIDSNGKSPVRLEFHEPIKPKKRRIIRLLGGQLYG